jgi:hypothetical protein
MNTTKKILILLTSCFLVSCKLNTVSNNATITFKNSEYDFGQLELNGNGNYSFVFNNTGDTPLNIQDVKTSCGCTVPQWPSKPIKPGRSSEIKINYDTKHPGRFHKTITVYYNGKDSPITLTIKGSVDYPDDITKE